MNDHDRPVKLPMVLALDDDTRIPTRTGTPEQFEQAARYLDEHPDDPAWADSPEWAAELAAELRRLAAVALKRPVVTCDHDRPSLADHRAALLATLAILDGADLKAAHEAAEGGSCPACVATAGISYGLTLASTVAGDTAFMNEALRLQLIAATEATLRDLDSSAN